MISRWEYKRVYHIMKPELDLLGNEGWELICVQEGWYIFKRRSLF